MCKNCDAPGEHSSPGDCRAAQRKEIRRLRSENEKLKGMCHEYELLYDQAKEAFRKHSKSD